MSDTSLLLSLPLIQPAQAQKHVTHNEALRLLDILVQTVVASRSRTTPPERPAAGERHVVAGPATGDWAGRETQIAVHDGSAWSFVVPQAGWRAFVMEEGQDVTFVGGGWVAPQAQTLGINTAADSLNRLSVRAGASLLTHEGSDHQLKINKNATADTGSLLFQSNWSGRAEMGLIGSDAFAIKVSADGAVFATALEAAPSGAVRLPQGPLTIGSHAAFHAGNVLGEVGLASGTPTGALIQAGEAEGGRFTRLADGTLLCIRACTVDVTTTAAQTFPLPAPFAAAPVSVSLSHSSPAAHAQLALGNIAAVGVADGAFFLRLKEAGAATTAAAQEVVLSAVGRWA